LGEFADRMKKELQETLETAERLNKEYRMRLERRESSRLLEWMDQVVDPLRKFLNPPGTKGDLHSPSDSDPQDQS
jgi:hypothetical protein